MRFRFFRWRQRLSSRQRRLVCELLFVLSFVSVSPASWAAEPIQPLQMPDDLNSEKVALGEKLFHDNRLSKDGTISCASCHNIATAGVDGTPTSVGVDGQTGDRNSPTVFNSGLNFRQFWDGRASTLEEQVDGPISNPIEMGLSWPVAVERIATEPEYKRLFKAIYDQPANADNIKDAIAEYERSLVTVDSPFDQYLKGHSDALTHQQKRGYDLFKLYGCVACHQGANVGGNMYQVFGVMRDISERTGAEEDLGRYHVTGRERDRYVFKVPSLRLAARTAPYFHDGSVATLEEAVDVMIKFQLRRTVPEEDRAAIVAFLESLVGFYKGERL